MAEKIGTFSRLYLSPGEADSGTYVQLEFLEGSSLGLTEQFLDSDGMTGSRFRLAERTRRGTRQAQGQLTLAPTPAELDLLLPWCTGGTKSGDVIDPAETVPARCLRADRDGVVELYDGLKVASFGFSASEGSILQMTLQLAGRDEVSSTTPSSPTAIDTAAGPYVMHDCVLTVGGTAYPFRQFSFQADNGLETRFNNSVLPTSIHSNAFRPQIQLGLPLGDASALYGSALAGVNVVATFTNGNRSLTITCAGAQAPRQPKEFGTRRALTLNWGATVRRSGSNPIVRFTNDSTG